MDHPFWRTGFVITDPKDIATILASSIKEVWIDVSKGLDLAAGEIAVTAAESDQQAERQLLDASLVKPVQKSVSVREEFAMAARICSPRQAGRDVDVSGSPHGQRH